MSDPAPYHRKLAEAITGCTAKHDWMESPVLLTRKQIIAVLTAEGVVDPEQYRDVENTASAAFKTVSDLQQEVKRMEADIEHLQFAHDEATPESEIVVLRQHNEELLEKISLNDCACSYDKPGDVCTTHSPTVKRLEKDIERMLCHADDLIADWQAGNINTKDMAVRLHLFVETVRQRSTGDSDAT